jgi:hypothetical protein
MRADLMGIDSHAHHTLGLVVLGALVGGCLLQFPDYEVASGGSSSTGGGVSTGGSSSSATLEPDGAPCEVADQCVSGHCLPGLDGGRMCCAIDCEVRAPSMCGTTGQCLGGTECVRYPDGLVCDPSERCDVATIYSFRCVGNECAEQGAPCPGGLSCAADGEACRPSCSMDADCANGGGCTIDGKCQKGPGETCSAGPDCVSGICGSNGSGRCCTGPCDGGPDTCDRDCDDTGACVFAPATTPCEVSTCADGNQLEARFCDGGGVCNRQSEIQSCPDNLACEDAADCWSSCLSNDAEGDARCAEGYWCAVPWFEPDVLRCSPKIGFLGLCNRDSMCLSGQCMIPFCL